MNSGVYLPAKEARPVCVDVFNENAEPPEMALAMTVHWMVFAIEVLLTFLRSTFVREENSLNSSDFNLFPKYLLHRPTDPRQQKRKHLLLLPSALLGLHHLPLTQRKGNGHLQSACPVSGT